METRDFKYFDKLENHMYESIGGIDKCVDCCEDCSTCFHKENCDGFIDTLDLIDYIFNHT